jgi:hypothetical protein
MFCGVDVCIIVVKLGLLLLTCGVLDARHVYFRSGETVVLDGDDFSALVLKLSSRGRGARPAPMWSFGVVVGGGG